MKRRKEDFLEKNEIKEQRPNRVKSQLLTPIQNSSIYSNISIIARKY